MARVEGRLVGQESLLRFGLGLVGLLEALGGLGLQILVLVGSAAAELVHVWLGVHLLVRVSALVRPPDGERVVLDGCLWLLSLVRGVALFLRLAEVLVPIDLRSSEGVVAL